MRIAVNTRFLLQDHLEGVGYFIFENFRRITANHPEHQFIFIFDRPYDNRFIFGENVTAVVLGPSARHPLLWKLWFDFRLPAVLKKYDADVFVSGDGFCSLATNLPQCLVVHDLAFLHFPKFFKRPHLVYYKYFTPRFLQKAKTIVTVSEFSRNDIVQKYQITTDRISVVPNAARDIFKPSGIDEKAAIKSRYSAGKEYFLYTGSIHPRKNLMNLLKAFSIFKKRQKSNWKLVLVGRLAWKYKDFIDSLKTYKYRDDVILTGYIDENELAAITAAAYAMVYPSYWEGFGLPVIEAMQSGVPVITSKESAMHELAGEAAIYLNPSDYKDIAEKMMLLYKDESLREKLINKGINRAKEYNWDTSSQLLWEVILQTAVKNKATVYENASSQNLSA
jgi:glycosyltransferase involved in cell wall biosynthesis